MIVREAFKNKNDETYGIFHMLVDYLAQRMVVEGGGSTNIWKIPYVLSFLFLKASLTLQL